MLWTMDTCKHSLLTVVEHPVKMAAGTSHRYAEADPVLHLRRCVYCNALVPPAGDVANDTPEALLELRAVEIVLMTDEEREALPLDQQLAFAEGFDDRSLDAVAHNFKDSPVVLHSLSYDAGEHAAWLAAQIIQHEIEGGPK